MPCKCIETVVCEATDMLPMAHCVCEQHRSLVLFGTRDATTMAVATWKLHMQTIGAMCVLV